MPFSLNDKILVNEKEYHVTGIDRYTLLNFYEQTKKWDSYTLSRPVREKIWLASGLERGIIIWKKSTLPASNKFAEFKFNPERSGFATIDFEGNAGFSTPLAELLWFDNTNLMRKFDFFTIERFFKTPLQIGNISTYYYTGRRESGTIQVMR